jgi:hypothetical protein
VFDWFLLTTFVPVKNDCDMKYCLVLLSSYD